MRFSFAILCCWNREPRTPEISQNFKKKFVGVCSPTSTTTSSATPGGGKMLLDSTSRELSFETNLSAANSITKRSIYGMNVNRHVPRSLDHFVGDPLVILRSLPQFCQGLLQNCCLLRVHCLHCILPQNGDDPTQKCLILFRNR